MQSKVKNIIMIRSAKRYQYKKYFMDDLNGIWMQRYWQNSMEIELCTTESDHTVQDVSLLYRSLQLALNLWKMTVLKNRIKRKKRHTIKRHEFNCQVQQEYYCPLPLTWALLLAVTKIIKCFHWASEMDLMTVITLGIVI